MQKERMLGHFNTAPCEENGRAEYEYCVCCKRLTNVLRTESIKIRAYYISGAGQLCEKCFNEIQSEMMEEKLRRRDLELRRLLEICKDDETWDK